MESEKNKEEVEVCKACTTESGSVLMAIIDGNDFIHYFVLFPDGTLQIQVRDKWSSPCIGGGYDFGQLKCCPKCGREF